MKYIYVCDDPSDSRIPENATVLSFQDYFENFQPDINESTKVTLIPSRSNPGLGFLDLRHCSNPGALGLASYSGLDSDECLTVQGYSDG